MQGERPTTFKTILVATDFSDTGEDALDQALLLAAERAGAELHVVYVATPAGDMVEVATPEGPKVMSSGQAVKHLQEHVERARVDAIVEGEPIESERISVHVRAGVSKDEIVQLADDLAVDLLVVGTHGRRGLRQLVLGSVAESVVRAAKCPVLVVRPKRYPPPEA